MREEKSRCWRDSKSDRLFPLQVDNLDSIPGNIYGPPSNTRSSLELKARSKPRKPLDMTQKTKENKKRKIQNNCLLSLNHKNALTLLFNISFLGRKNSADSANNQVYGIAQEFKHRS